MTREQIMALEGRKLDAAVAEHVMGWHTIRELVNTGTNRVGKGKYKRAEGGKGA